MRKRVKHRPVKWEQAEILRLEKDLEIGPHCVRVITEKGNDGSYTYRPMSLPGNPQTGDFVEVAWGYFGNVKQCRCRVAGREYVAIANGPVWQALDTGEIFYMR